MALTIRLNADLKTAILQGDATRRDTLRLLLSSLKNAEIEARGPLDDEAANRVVNREIKQRRDSIAEYRKGRREDLAEREQCELEILMEYQTGQLSDEELRRIVVDAIRCTAARSMADMGRVMRVAMLEVKGRADGARVNAIARGILMDGS